MSRHKVTGEFRLKNGKLLQVVYYYTYISGGYWDPPESEVGEAEVFLDKELVTVDETNYSFKVPKGLETIITHLIEETTPTIKGCKITIEDAERCYEDFD